MRRFTADRFSPRAFFHGKEGRGGRQKPTHDGGVDAALDGVPPGTRRLGQPAKGRIHASVELLHRHVDPVPAPVRHLRGAESRTNKLGEKSTRTTNK